LVPPDFPESTMGFIASCCSSINRQTNQERWSWSCLEFCTINSIAPVIIQLKKFYVTCKKTSLHSGGR
jgi:hypothetical protein